MHFMMARVANQFAKNSAEMHQLYWMFGEHFLSLVEQRKIKEGPYLEQCMQNLVLDLANLNPYDIKYQQQAHDIIEKNKQHTIKQSNFIHSIHGKPFRSSI